MSASALEIQSVSKRFARVLFDGASMRLEHGRGAVLSGPNGSGKSTLLKLVTGVLLPDAGSIRVDRGLGYCPSSSDGFYRRLSARQNLRHFGSLYGLRPREVDHALSRLPLFGIDYWDTPAERLSDGMLQKLKILRAFLHEPRFVALDEPMNFLDREARRAFAHWLAAWVRERPGRSYLVAQHSPEVEGERWGIRDGKLERTDA